MWSRILGSMQLFMKEVSHMTQSLKWLVAASVVNLISNSLGTLVAFQYHLTAGFGGLLHGEDMVRDFVTFNGTALSAPLPFLLIQLVLTGLALRPARVGDIGVMGLIVVGALYTLAQLGEPIVLRMISPGGFDLLQAIILMVNEASSLAMLIVGIQIWRSARPSTRRRFMRPM
jgi:hypothetical protein